MHTPKGLACKGLIDVIINVLLGIIIIIITIFGMITDQAVLSPT